MQYRHGWQASLLFQTLLLAAHANSLVNFKETLADRSLNPVDTRTTACFHANQIDRDRKTADQWLVMVGEHHQSPAITVMMINLK